MDTSETFAQEGLVGAGTPVYCLWSDEGCTGGAELGEFLDGTIAGGGMSANYYYFTDSDSQIVLVCYQAYNNNFAGCAGNGFNTLPESSPITEQQFDADEQAITCTGSGCRSGHWDADDETWKSGVQSLSN